MKRGANDGKEERSVDNEQRFTLLAKLLFDSNTIHMQAIASLASFIGSVNYSDSFHLAAAAQRETLVEDNTQPTIEATAEYATYSDDDSMQNAMKIKAENPMFDMKGMSEAVQHANNIAKVYGVEILSINIISANPVDKVLTASLASGAVASAEALQAETAARGQAKAMKIRADATASEQLVLSRSDAEASIIAATAFAESEIKKAEGKKRAAELLSSNQVAVDLAKMELSSKAINKSDKFFFSEQPEYMKNVIMPLRLAVEDS